MRDVLGKGLRNLNRIKTRKIRMSVFLLVLSLVVSLDVFWSLRQPGLTLAGNADCGIVEHTHDETCQNAQSACELTPHVHDLSCYTDDTADTETQLDWQEMFAGYPYTGDLRKDLVGIAEMQVGYAESTRNFQVGSDGIRRGYTRYGAWYGLPYSDWSATFVSFCLHYAGADEATAPKNTGADSMAKLWKDLNKYASVGDYDPVAGDLVFFKNNTVGIIAKVNGSTLYIIRGDVQDAVRGESVSSTDASIDGWGVTVGTARTYGVHLTQEQLDITNGPAFYIFEGNSMRPQMKTFSLRAIRTVKDLIEYLNANGGSYFFTLLDKDNHELPKDDQGNYIVQAEDEYKLTISFTGPNGFVPGTYQYQIPQGLLVDGGNGTFVLKDGTHVGDWTVTDDGLITLNFNENMNSRTEITISATLGIHFPQQDDPIDFDGKISVSIQKPTVEQEQTKLNKWGSPGQEKDGKDPSKIYWTVEIQGKEGSQIPGSTITDQLGKGDQRFTQSDIDGGLHFGAGEYDLETGEQVAWHAWEVSADDPNLVWTETGWTYQMPESVQCKWCPAPVQLGNNGWIYYIEYTSTPDPMGIEGTIWYTNEVEVDKQWMEGWGNFVHAPAEAKIFKNGTFHGDADGGVFLWEFRTTIPSMKEGEKAVYLWQMMDNLRVKDSGNETVGHIINDADHATVTATHGDGTFTVPHVSDATAQDEIAWYNLWSADHNDGIYYGRALVLLHRCHCTQENCQFWADGSCSSKYWYKAEDGYWYTNDMCYCWTEEEDTALTFSYKTDDISVIEKYGGQNNYLQNEVLLQNTNYLPDGSPQTITHGSATADVPIPGVFKKELTRDYDGYTAHYKVTVNEGKVALTNGSPLTIHDVMTETLVFISGSLEITAEDADGNVTKLTQGVDYTVTYDGTGNVTDAQGKKVHVLDIVILHPQPVMYTLNYDTTLTIPVGVTEAIKYSNSATITLWGEKITDTSTEKVYADINIAAKNYKVEMFKTCAMTGQPLGGATFGLFNENGGLITTDVSDEQGELVFQSNIIEGIVLREHVLYYMQELRAPPGYQLDDTKYWFCFCNETKTTCQTCEELLAETNAQRIPFEQIGKVHVSNQIINYNLPATGGSGVYPLILASVILIIIPFVYRFIRRRKREGRGVG